MGLNFTSSSDHPTRHTTNHVITINLHTGYLDVFLPRLGCEYHIGKGYEYTHDD
jgi:hypothetical protein